MNKAIYDYAMQYTDGHGFCAPSINGGSLNGVLYTAHMMIVLNDNDALPKEQIEKWKETFGKCFLEPGLLTRTPDHHRDQQAHDDIAGLCAVAYLFGWDYAKEINEYGKKTTKFGPFNFKAVFNNVIPDTVLIPEDRLDREVSTIERLAIKLWGKPGTLFNMVAWNGRMPSVVAHIKYCAGERPNFLLRLIHALDIAYSAYKDDWWLSWLLVRTLDKRSWMGMLASKYWYYKLYKMHPNGLRDIAYLDNDPQHPNVKYWVK